VRSGDGWHLGDTTAVGRMLRLEGERSACDGPAATTPVLQATAKRGRLLPGLGGCCSCCPHAANCSAPSEGSSPSSASSSPGCCCCCCCCCRTGGAVVHSSSAAVPAAAAGWLECGRFLLCSCPALPPGRPEHCGCCCCCCCCCVLTGNCAVAVAAAPPTCCWRLCRGHTTNRLDTRRTSWGRQRTCQPRSQSMHCTMGTPSPLRPHCAQ
jgi:hypothetical protein